MSKNALRVGVGGPVGCGKTALIEMLCKAMRDKWNIGVVTNDIYTKEDQRILTEAGALDAAIDELNHRFKDLDLIFIESGGDNLSATFSPELADITIYVIDVSEGEKIPRKGGPGITKSSFFVINKTDLAPYVGASLEVMEKDTMKMRPKLPWTFTNLKKNEGVDKVIAFIEKYLNI